MKKFLLILLALLVFAVLTIGAKTLVETLISAVLVAIVMRLVFAYTDL